MCECSGKSNIGKYFGTIGGQFGDIVDTKLTSVASAARKKFKDWTGLGDYKITYNSLINPDHEPVSFASHGRGLIIRHKEYLGDVVTAPVTVGAFNVTKFTINPGNVISFPWLSPIALQHDQYRPRGIIFEFVSTASETSTSATLGSVLFSTLYDVTDPDPTSKADMMNRAYSNETKMSQSALHGLECDPSELQNDILYTRAYGSTVQNPRDFDMANFYVGTQGGSLPINTVVGSLYVHYEFEFFKQIPAGGLPAKTNIWAVYTSSATAAGTMSVNFDNWPLVLTYGRDLGITYLTNTIYIPKAWAGATFLIELLCYSASGYTSVNATGYTALNCTAKSSGFGAAGYWRSVRPGAASVTGTNSTLLITVNPNITTDASITWSPSIATWPATVISIPVIIGVSFQLVNANYNTLL